MKLRYLSKSTKRETFINTDQVDYAFLEIIDKIPMLTMIITGERVTVSNDLALDIWAKIKDLTVGVTTVD